MKLKQSQLRVKRVKKKTKESQYLYSLVSFKRERDTWDMLFPLGLGSGGGHGELGKHGL